jgi:hypothetical protein
MPPVPSPPQDPQSIGVLITAAVTLCVLYWRVAIRIVIIVVIALTLYGGVLFAEALQRAGR